MAGWSALGAGVKTLVLGGAAATVAVVGAVVWQARTAPVPEPVVVEAADPTPVAAAPAEPPAAVEPAPSTPAASPTPTAAAVPPSFDVVRVEPDGATLVAGRAGAGLQVAVLIDGAEAALAEADRQGRFVVFLTLASSTSARIMTLESRPTGREAVPSEDQVLLAPNAAAEPVPEKVAEEPAAAPVAESPAEAVAQADPPAAEPAAIDTPAAPVPEVAAIPAPEVESAPVAETASKAPVMLAEPTPTAAPAPAAAPLTNPEVSVASAADPVTGSAATVEPPADPVPAPMKEPEASPPEVDLAALEPEPEPQPEPEPVQAAMAPAPVAAAPTALLLTGNSVKVLQSAASEPAAPTGTVSIDAISYTASGEVALSGRGAAQAFVRLYLDNRALLETAIAEDGTWGGTLPAVAPGVYTLRADQVSAAGQVTSRFETPFQREDPVALAAPAPTVAAPAGETPQAAPTLRRVSITVQPGFTLWQIARENYGDGTLYVRVYDANKTLIRDPDLIYPGQVFSVPTGN